MDLPEQIKENLLKQISADLKERGIEGLEYSCMPNVVYTAEFPDVNHISLSRPNVRYEVDLHFKLKDEIEPGTIDWVTIQRMLNGILLYLDMEQVKPEFWEHASEAEIITELMEDNMRLQMELDQAKEALRQGGVIL